MKFNTPFYTQFLFDVDNGSGGATGTSGGNPPAATTTAPGAGGATPPASASSGNFYDTFKNEENKHFALKKGYESPEAAIESYRNLEKLQGVPKERLLTLPEKMDDVKAVAELFERLGKPKDAKDYKFKTETGDQFGEWARTAFHEANLTETQADVVINKYREMAKGLQGNQSAADLAKVQRGTEELKAAWGNAYEQNMNIAQAGAKEFGFTKEGVAAMEKAIGTKATLETLKNIGSKLGEAQFARGGQGGGQGFSGKLSPDMAKAEMKSRLADPAFAAKYTSGDADAMRIITKLQMDAHPGDMTI